MVGSVSWLFDDDAAAASDSHVLDDKDEACCGLLDAKARAG